MNETIKAGENFGITKNGNLVHQDVFLEPGKVYGHTKIMINDDVILDKTNAIVGGSGTSSPTGLKAYFAESMSTPVDRALNDLFGTGDVNIVGVASGTPLTEDGIAVAADLGDFGNNTAPVRTMETTVLTPASNTYGRKWRGVLTAGQARQFGAAKIGHSAVNTGDFTTGYATQQFQTQTLASGDTLTIEWEIFIA